MKNILWVQTKTETGSDAILRNGEIGSQADYDEMRQIKKTTSWEQLTPEPYNVKKCEDMFFIQGYLEDVDYLSSRLPFEFLCYCTSFHELFVDLKKALETLNYRLNENDVNRTIGRLKNSNVSINGTCLKIDLLVAYLEKLISICKKLAEFCKKHPIVSLIVAALFAVVVKKILQGDN